MISIDISVAQIAGLVAALAFIYCMVVLFERSFNR